MSGQGRMQADTLIPFRSLPAIEDDARCRKQISAGLICPFSDTDVLSSLVARAENERTFNAKFSQSGKHWQAVSVSRPASQKQKTGKAFAVPGDLGRIRLFAVNRDDRLAVNAQHAGHMIIHMLDLGDPAVGGRSLDAGITPGKSDHAFGGG